MCITLVSWLVFLSSQPFHLIESRVVITIFIYGTFKSWRFAYRDRIATHGALKIASLVLIYLKVSPLRCQLGLQHK